MVAVIIISIKQDYLIPRMVGQVLVDRDHVLPIATNRSNHPNKPLSHVLLGFCVCEGVVVVIVVVSTLGEEGPTGTVGIAILRLVDRLKSRPFFHFILDN